MSSILKRLSESDLGSTTKRSDNLYAIQEKTCSLIVCFSTWLMFVVLIMFVYWLMFSQILTINYNGRNCE